MIDSRFEKGMRVRTAGKTTKARSGPARGISEMGIPVFTDIYPMKLNTTIDERNPHITVSEGITIDDLITSCDFGR